MIDLGKITLILMNHALCRFTTRIDHKVRTSQQVEEVVRRGFIRVACIHLATTIAYYYVRINYGQKLYYAVLKRESDTAVVITFLPSEYFIPWAKKLLENPDPNWDIKVFQPEENQN